MEIVVNGKNEVGEYSTVADLLYKQDLEPRQVLVELNGAIVPKGDYEKTFLKEGDVLELVHFVAGG